MGIGLAVLHGRGTTMSDVAAAFTNKFAHVPF